MGVDVVNLSERRAGWIWHISKDRSVNQYVEFRRVFDGVETGEAELQIAADTNYVVWLNGTFVGSGQFADIPGQETFTTFKIGPLLQQGQNVLAVLVHYCGQDHFSYISNQPGLWFMLKHVQDVIASDEQTYCRKSSSYHQGPRPRISAQRGFTFCYDARFADNWTDTDYRAEKEWQPAVIFRKDCAPRPRPVASLQKSRRAAGTIIAQGVFKRCAKEGASVGELMQSDYLSARKAHEFYEKGILNDDQTVFPVRFCCSRSDCQEGAYLVIDLSREECGFIELELDASAGAIVDVGVGEHLADLRVRSAVGGRNFASRYIACDGHQHFIYYLDRFAGRYLQLHFSNTDHPITLGYAGLIPSNYPVAFRGAFFCSDSRLERIYEVARHTLHLCMHERYEDCPWREQALYGEDARIEALVGYYLFGEYDLARTSLELLGRSMEDDAYIKISAPNRMDLKIPVATMSWILGVTEYIRFSGNVDAAGELLQRTDFLMRMLCEERVDNLLPTPRGKRYWHFYDWGEGLSGRIARMDEEALAEQRFDAILNFSMIVALTELAGVFEACGRDASWCNLYAAAMRQAAHQTFWNPNQRSYMTYVGPSVAGEHYAEMTQALALLANVPEPREAGELRDRLAQPENGWVPISLGMYVYKLDAILSSAESLAAQTYKMISELWGTMLDAGATTFWETIKGEKDFNGAGSLCHGFSTIPAYIYQRYVLGIKPLAAGFSRFQVRPVFGNYSWARGVVPTPAGDIYVSWEKQENKYTGCLRYPESLEPVVVDTDAGCLWELIKI